VVASRPRETILPFVRAALLITILSVALLPIVYLSALSFKTPDQVLEGLFLPTKPTLRNWINIFQNIPLALYIANSAISAISGSLITLVITIPAVYALSRIRIGAFLPGIILGSYMAPPMVPLIPLFFLAKWSGLIHTLPGLIICYGILNIPVAIWLLTGFIERIPEEIEEAAAIDGAGVLRTLCQIVVPLMLPGIVSTGLICVILNYNEFLFAFFFTGNTKRTLPIGIALFQGERLFDFGQMAVASLIGVLPIYLTALLGTLPGGAGEMIAMSDSLGADVRLVTVMQYGRLLAILATISVVLHLAGASIDGTHGTRPAAGHLLEPIHYLISAVIALIGAALGTHFRVPAGTMIIPAVLAAIAGIIGVPAAPWPPPVLATAAAAPALLTMLSS
jgi:multiple sugar transport system permease protein